MAQNRDAPAFQEYPASMMARLPYRTMSLAGRGLLYSLRLECWVNRCVPADPRTLAKVLGYECAEVEKALHEVMPFFTVENGALYCPELEDYRTHIANIREKQSQGGKQGAAKTNCKRQQPEPQAEAGNPTSHPRVTRESLVKSSPVKSSPVKQSPDVLTVDDSIREWTDEYDQASNGY